MKWKTKEREVGKGGERERKGEERGKGTERQREKGRESERKEGKIHTERGKRERE